MTDENMLEEKCSCGASIKVVLPTSIGTMGERKELLERLEAWHVRHRDCMRARPMLRTLQRPPAPNPPPPKERA